MFLSASQHQNLLNSELTQSSAESKTRVCGSCFEEKSITGVEHEDYLCNAIIGMKVPRLN